MSLPPVEGVESVEVDLAGPLVVLPIRHHSPACAIHVATVIERVQPRWVLIEGPEDGNELIEHLLDQQTVPPVALYGFVRASDDRPGRACWYPFCDYSPELVALRTARAIGARAAFIDLPTWWWAGLKSAEDEDQVNVYADHELRFHHFLDELCQRVGSRDFDELWDTLFEADGPDREPGRFFNDVGTYCRIARVGSKADRPRTLIRELHMTSRIAARLPDGPVVVVTGGYHRDGLLAHLGAGVKAPESPKPPKVSERGCYLCAYGEEQLDRWSGYESGMPTPAFYRVWWDAVSGREDRGLAELLSRGALALRGEKEVLSTADVIAAETTRRALADFRGHVRPTREDARDAVRSTWVKGAVGGRAIDGFDKFLVGHRVGKVCPGAGTPPIVRDFEAVAKRLRLPTDAEGKRERNVSLDIHAAGSAREKSSFLHRLRALEIPYGEFVAGPDFARGVDVERLREIWKITWRPQTLGSLIEQSRWGASVAEASQRRLLGRLRERGERASAKQAASLLIDALVMGFSHLLDDFLALVERSVLESAEFADAAGAFAALAVVVGYRPLLGAEGQPRILELARRAFERAVWLIDQLPGGAVADESANLEGLRVLRQAVLADDVIQLDGPHFLDAVERAREKLGSRPLLEGAAVGILRQAGRWDDQAVLHAVRASVDNTASGSEMPLGDFLRGLFTMTRHAVSEGTGVLDAIDACVAELDDDRFVAALPGLRWAFSLFPPRELRSIADRLAHSPTASSSADGNHVATSEHGVNEAAVACSAERESVHRIDARLRAALHRWQADGD